VKRPNHRLRFRFGFLGHPIFAWLLFLVLSAVFLGDALLSGGAYLLRDVLTFHHPWQYAVREAVLSGRLPLWNHQTYCGIPLLANLQAGTFYPLHWLSWGLSFDRALTLEMMFHLLLAGVLMHRFLRRVGMGGAGAILGGVGFAFGAWTISYLEFPMKLGSAVWLPLVWCGVWDAMHGAVRRGIAWTALALTLSFFAGYPQLVFLQFISAGFLALALIPHALRDRFSRSPDKLWRIAAFPTAVLLSAILAGAQLLPAREMASYSTKAAGYPPEIAMTRSLPPQGLFGVLDPYFLGYPGIDRFWGGDIEEYCFSTLYVGALTLPLLFSAFAGAVRAIGDLWQGRNRYRRHPNSKTQLIDGPPPDAQVAGGLALFVFLVAGAALALILSLGKHTPIYSYLLEFVPGFDRMRWPATAEFLLAAHLSALAGVGLDTAFRRGHISRLLSAMILFLGIAVLAVAFLGRGPLAPALRALQTATAYPDQLAIYDSLRDGWLDSLTVRGGLIAIAGALGLFFSRRLALVSSLWIAIVVLDLFMASRSLEMPLARGFYDRVPASVAQLGDSLQGHRVFTPRSTDQLGNFLYGSRNPISFDWAQRAMLCNANIPAGIFQVQGCEPLSPRRHEAFVQAFESPATPWEIKERVFDLWDAGALIVANGVTAEEMPRLTNANQGVLMSKHDPRLARATLLRGWKTVDYPEEILARLFAPEHDPKSATILEAAPGQSPPQPREQFPDAEGEALAVRYERGQIRVAWQLGRSGMLRILESWAPGWRAKVNGQPAPVHRADFLFMAVPVPDGPCEVVLTYQPASFRNGVVLSLAGFVGLLFCFAGPGTPRRILPAQTSATRENPRSR